MRTKKPNKFCKLYGIEIEFEKPLTDPEVRLFHIYLRIVAWDVKHTETFGSSDISIRGLRKNYLPDWSVGKLGYTRQNLIKKGWLQKRSDGSIAVAGYKAYRLKDVQQAEQAIQRMRQSVQIDGQTVQPVEQDAVNGYDSFQKIGAVLSKKRLDFVQPIE